MAISKKYNSYHFSEYFNTEIPSHWQEKQLGYLAKQDRNAFVDGPFGSDLKTTDYQDSGVPLIQLNNIRDGQHILKNIKFVTEIKKRQLVRHVAYPKDLVIAKMAEPVARAAVVNDIYPEYVIVADCVKMTPETAIINTKFLVWAINSDYVRINAELVSTGTTRIRINLGELKKLKIPYPLLSEQASISAFLDHETTKIDNLIEKQQQLIELLKEKRQTVISHAVTKGMNPDVPMKDSGVEWLGKVPQHWEVKRIKHFGKVIGGFAFKSSDFTDEGYPVIKISNVSHLSFDWGDSSFLPPSFSFTHKEYLAPNGALVFAMTRPVISGGIKVTLLDDDSAPLVNQRVGFMMVKSKNMARYILISTQSSAFLAHFVNNMTVTNQPNISSEGIESIYLPVPPMNEISRILLYVDRMNESYNRLIDKALLQVSLLQERRTALISAAVTGKIDVRDWVAPATQEAEEPQEATA